MQLTSLPPELIARIAIDHCATDTDAKNLYDVYNNCVSGSSSTWVGARQAHIAKSLAATELQAPRIPLRSESDLRDTLKRQFGLAVGGRTSTQAQPRPISTTLNEIAPAIASPDTASRMERVMQTGVLLFCLVGAVVLTAVGCCLAFLAFGLLCLFSPLVLGYTSGAMVSATLVRFYREDQYARASSDAEQRGVARARQDLLRKLDFMGECDAMFTADQILSSLRQAADAELRRTRVQNLKKDLAGDALMFACSLSAYPILWLQGGRPLDVPLSEHLRSLVSLSGYGAVMTAMGAAVGFFFQSALFATGINFGTALHDDKVCSVPRIVDDKSQTMKALEDHAYLSYLSRVKSSRTSCSMQESPTERLTEVALS